MSKYSSMCQLLERILDRRPGIGYVSSVASTGLTLASQPLIDPLAEWAEWVRILGWMGVLIGVATGILTFIIQLYRFQRVRRGVDSEPPFEVKPPHRNPNSRHGHRHKGHK